MDFHCLKRQILNNMNKTNIAIVIYVLGLLFGAFVLDIWSAETSPKALLGIHLDSIIRNISILFRI